MSTTTVASSGVGKAGEDASFTHLESSSGYATDKSNYYLIVIILRKLCL